MNFAAKLQIKTEIRIKLLWKMEKTHLFLVSLPSKEGKFPLAAAPFVIKKIYL